MENFHLLSVIRHVAKSSGSVLVLLGGPTGVGKSSALEHLSYSMPKCAVLDADDVWRVGSELGLPENRQIAIQNTISVMQGYFQAGCEIGILAWVFARELLYGPVLEAMKEDDIPVLQLYLIADERRLEQRLRQRGELNRLEYSISRLRLIEELPYPKIDTSNLTPVEVAESVREHIHAGV